MPGLIFFPDNLIRLLPFLDSLANLAGESEVIGRARGPPGSDDASSAAMLRFHIIVKGFTLNSPIAYFGGKAKLANKLLPLFPTHKRYVEVFGGGGSILFAKSLSDLEVYNDIDSALYEFFTVLADAKQFAKFKRLIEPLPLCRELHVNCARTWHTEKTPVARVAKWYTAMRQGFSGRLSESWGYSVQQGRNGKSQAVSKWIGGIDRLPEVHGRKSGEYRFEMTEEDHRELIEILLSLQGKVLLSGYDTELYRPLEKKGWERREFAVTCSAAGRVRGSGLQGKGKVKEKQQRTEVVWANYPLPA
jgi:DNA adenine methylase